MPQADSGMLSQRGKLKRFQHCHLQGPMLAGFVPEGSSDGVQQNKGDVHSGNSIASWRV